MCLHLLKAGYQCRVYNRSKDKAQEVLDHGGIWGVNPAQVAAESQVVFTMVGLPQDVQETVLGPNGVLVGAQSGSILVDMTTSKPALARQIYQQAADKGAQALDAPVSGGDLGARQASLAIMVGGDRVVFERIRPLFEVLGRDIAYLGPAGLGQDAKMSNQILIASTMIGVVESLLYAYRAGLDLDQVIDVLGQGAAGCWSLNHLGRRIVQGDFRPGFYIRHFIKDMGIALEEAQRMGLALPGLALANQFYLAAQAQGLEGLGTQALYKVLKQLNSLS
jgi:3-hydroxyisobutyrate dehydrogenase